MRVLSLTCLFQQMTHCASGIWNVSCAMLLALHGAYASILSRNMPISGSRLSHRLISFARRGHRG